jgi:acyl-CoA dehydrogenase
LLAYELPPPSARARELQERMHAFMRDRVLPAEGEYLAHRRAAGPDGHVLPPVVEKLKEQARAEGLWNLFLPA